MPQVAVKQLTSGSTGELLVTRGGVVDHEKLKPDSLNGPTAAANQVPFVVDTLTFGTDNAFKWNNTDKTVDLSGGVAFTERADHPGTPAPGKGILWVKSDTPNVIMFTDDAGTDHDLSGGGVHPDPHQLGDGTSGAPTYSFSSNTDSGIYYNSTFNHMYMVFDATKHIEINSTGVCIGTGSQPAAGYALTVYQNIYTTGNSRVDGQRHAGLGSAATPSYSYYGDQNSGSYYLNVSGGYVIHVFGGSQRIVMNATGTSIGSSGAPVVGYHLYTASLYTQFAHLGSGSAGAPGWGMYENTDCGAYYLKTGVGSPAVVFVYDSAQRIVMNATGVSIGSSGSPQAGYGLYVGGKMWSSDDMETSARGVWRASGAAVSSASTGAIRFFTTTSKLQVSENGGAWVDLIPGGGGGVGGAGSGTDNYLARWNGTTLLETSVVYDDGTNIGLGTISPDAKLHVSNKPAIGVASFLVGDDTSMGGTMAAGVPKILIGDTQDAWQTFLYFAHSSSEYAYIDYSQGGMHIKAFKHHINIEATDTNMGITLTSNASGQVTLKHRVGVGLVDVVAGNIMDVAGDVTIGSGYAGTNAAPTDGLLVEGKIGIGHTGTVNTALDMLGAISVKEMSAPAVSPSGEGRIYFDSTSKTFKVSENGGAYKGLFIGDKITGWGAPTGTDTRTTFATSTVTLEELAERIHALIDDLTSLGFIGA